MSTHHPLTASWRHPVRPVPAPRGRRGAPQKLTHLQLIELRAWDSAVRALGTLKDQCVKLGITTDTARNYLQGRHKLPHRGA